MSNYSIVDNYIIEKNEDNSFSVSKENIDITIKPSKNSKIEVKTVLSSESD